MLGADQWAHGDRIVGGIADHHAARQLGQPPDHVVVKRRRKQQPTVENAGLTRVQGAAFEEQS
nr:hypothetical protein CPGR_05265 [Mycolicibacter nonchromogenicus]